MQPLLREETFEKSVYQSLRVHRLNHVNQTLGSGTAAKSPENPGLGMRVFEPPTECTEGGAKR